MIESRSQRNPFTLWQLEVFCRVVELGGHSSAAENLDISQPAVSSLVGQLERLAGVPLVGRHGHAIKPTAEGRAVYDLAARIVDDASQLKDLLTGLSAFEGGAVRVASSPSISTFMVNAVSEFRQRYPQAEVSYQVESRRGMVAGLQDQRFDLVVMVGPGSDEDATTLVRDEMVVLAAPDFEFGGESPVTSLLGLQIFMNERATSYGPEIMTALQELGVSMDQVISIADRDVIRRVVEQNLGIAIVPRGSFGEHLPSGRFVEVNVAGFPSPVEFSVQSRHDEMTPLANALVTFLVDRASTGAVHA